MIGPLGLDVADLLDRSADKASKRALQLTQARRPVMDRDDGKPVAGSLIPDAPDGLEYAPIPRSEGGRPCDARGAEARERNDADEAVLAQEGGADLSLVAAYPRPR